MGGLDPKPLDRGENRPRRMASHGLTWLFIAAGTVAVAGIFMIILYNVGFTLLVSMPHTYSVALGDLDGDGDLDAFYANGENEGPRPNTVLINQGGAQGGQPGELHDSGQRLGKENSRTVTLADLDGDGDLDAWVANIGYSSIFFNGGQGRFAANGQHLFDDRIGNSGLWAIALGDLDADGDLDALGGACCGSIASGPEKQEVYRPLNLVWTNQGGAQGGRPGIFRDSGQALESLGARGVALGDLDGDGDLDAFFGNDSYIWETESQTDIGQPNTVWWNDGQGSFADSGQRLGNARTMDVALGDLDGDGDLDAYSANRGPDEIWLNAGGKQGGQPGLFVDSGQRLGDAFSSRVTLADLDKDGDLDAAIVVQTSRGMRAHVEFWLNDGQGNFSDNGQPITHFKADAFDLGDLDGDGYPDLFAGWFERGNTVWRNLGAGILFHQ